MHGRNPKRIACIANNSRCGRSKCRPTPQRGLTIVFRRACKSMAFPHQQLSRGDSNSRPCWRKRPSRCFMGSEQPWAEAPVAVVVDQPDQPVRGPFVLGLPLGLVPIPGFANAKRCTDQTDGHTMRRYCFLGRLASLRRPVYFFVSASLMLPRDRSKVDSDIGLTRLLQSRWLTGYGHNVKQSKCPWHFDRS